jgi:hypothetical protein
LPPQPKFAFEFGNLLIALDQFLPQFVILAAQTVDFPLQLLRFHRLPWRQLAMRCPQTSTLPGFSANSQVQIADS